MPRQALRAAPNALSQFELRFSFTFVLVFPVYRISAKGARAENPHETKAQCISFTIVLYFVPARRTFVCFVPSGGVQGPYLCAKMLLFSA